MHSTRALWVDDQYAVRCRRCDARFNMIRRRHHCRHCGQVFCSDCLLVLSATLVCNRVTDAISSFIGLQRESVTKVCHECDRILRQRSQLGREDGRFLDLLRRTLTDAPGLTEEIAVGKALDAKAAYEHDVNETRRMAHVSSLGLSVENEAPEETSCEEGIASSPSSCMCTQAPVARLPTHPESIEEREISSGLTDVPMYSTNSMLEWLRKLLTKTHTGLSSETPQPLNQICEKRTCVPVPKASFRISTRPLGPISLGNVFSPSVSAKALLCFEKQCSNHLIRRASRFFAESEVLSSKAGIDRVEWIARLCDLSWKVVSQLAVVPNEHIEERFDIICISGGGFADTELIPGLAFVQTIASKRMRTSVKAPSILLLAGDVGTAVNPQVDLSEYVEGYRGYLEKQYQRIHVWSPSVIVVEGSMHHYLQDRIIHNSYATLILNAGEAAIQRLSRCCSASVIHDLQYVSAADLRNSSALGTCDTFQLVHVGDKPLCVFSGFQVPLFSTIILRGGDQELLETAKQLLIDCIRMAYHLSLQAHCMLDLGMTCGMPTFNSATSDTEIDEPSDEKGRSPKSSFTYEEKSMDTNEIEEYMQLIASSPKAADRLETLSMNLGMTFPGEMADIDDKYDSMMMDSIIVNTVFFDCIMGGDDGGATAPNYSVRHSREVFPFYCEGDETLVEYLRGRAKEGDSTRLIVHGKKRIWVKTTTDFNSVHAFRFSAEQSASPFRLAASRRCAPPLRGGAACRDCCFGSEEGTGGGGTLSSLASELCSLHMLNLSWGSFMELLIYGSSLFTMSCGHTLNQNACLSFAMLHHTSVEVIVTISVESLSVYDLIPPSLTMPPCGDVAKLYLKNEVEELRHCVEEINAAIYAILATQATPNTQQQQQQQQQQQHSHLKSLLHPFPSLLSARGPGTLGASGFAEKGAELRQRGGDLLTKLFSLETLESVAHVRLDHLTEFVGDFSEWYNAGVSTAERRTGKACVVVDTTKLEDPYWAYSTHNSCAVRLNEPTCLVALAIQATRLWPGIQLEVTRDVVNIDPPQCAMASSRSNTDDSEAPPPAEESPQVLVETSMEVMLGIEPSVSPEILPSASFIRSASDALEILAGRTSAAKTTFKHVMDVLIPSEKGSHVTVTVEVMFPAQFAALQYLFSEGRVVEFVLALSRCRAFKPQGGKTKSDFFRTLDERFLLKQIKQAELIHFAEFGPNYFAHMGHIYSEATNDAAHTLLTPPGTALGKVLGVYSVHVKRRKRFAETPPEIRYFVLMENVLFSRRVDIAYDLKGSQRNRTAPEGSSVLLDQDLLGALQKSNFFYSTDDRKSLLMDTLACDAHLLSASSIMDYSLIAALNHERRQLYLAIVDYLHPYSGAKAIESKVKAGLDTVLGLPGRDPTIIDPTSYRIRFTRWLAGCFCGVPEKTFAAKRAQANARRRMVK